VIRSAPRTVLALLLLVAGIAAFLSVGGSAPGIAAPAPHGGQLQDAAPVAAAAALDTAEAVAAREPVRTAAPEPALRRTGTNTDGWAVYRLGSGRLPQRLAVGRGFRGEITWLQGGIERKARVYVPTSAPAAAPLLVSLHGLGQTLRSAEAQQRWSSLAFQQRFVLVWGAGHLGSWNAGPCCGAAAGRVDDLAYLDRTLEVVSALHGVDRRRIHLAGFSNGAMLAYRYACGRPGRIAGVLAVAGTHTAPCTPRKATAILAVNGTADPTVPLRGTRHSRALGARLPDVGTGPRLWAKTGAGVRRVVIPRFAHGWPTRHRGGYDATGEGWRFLKQRPLPR
jgi:predicted esterase